MLINNYHFKYSQRLKTETSLNQQGFQLIIGADEAGRGTLAGPVCAAAVIVAKKTRDKNFHFLLEKVDDSKKLTPLMRIKLYHLITTHPAIIWDMPLFLRL